jgi:ubiquinol-cytochrome c reductase cytochrome c subunit
MLRILLAALAVATPAAAQLPPASPQHLAGGPASPASSLYVRIGCSQCHGDAGQGGAAGPALNSHVFAAFAAQVRRPVREMPPYTEKVLSDEDLQGLFKFIQAMKP